MKVVTLVFDTVNANRVRELVDRISAAYKSLSPRNVREASNDFLKYIEESGFDRCVLNENEWRNILFEVRKTYRDFKADYILSDADARKLVGTVTNLPEPFKQILVAHSECGCFLLWLPLDEEVLDGVRL